MANNLKLPTIMLTFTLLFSTSAEAKWRFFKKYSVNRSITKSQLVNKAAKPKKEIWVVDIWASWCAPCVAAIPELKELYSEYQNKNVEFISVSYDVKRKDWVRALFRLQMPWPQIINYNPPFEEDEVKWQFPHTALPALYLIDKKGNIAQMRNMNDLKYNLSLLTR